MKPSIGSVLYIEDDKDTRELVTLLLEQSGYELVAAEDYDEALRLARTNRFDLYLIDNRMSGGSGIDLCKKLREFNPLHRSYSTLVLHMKLTSNRLSLQVRKRIWSSPQNPKS